MRNTLEFRRSPNLRFWGRRGTTIAISIKRRQATNIMEYKIINRRRTDTKRWEAKALGDGIPPVLRWEESESVERALLRYLETAPTVSMKAVKR